uniref:HNH endonuclease n=1 Tax=viral metagenome TaxID=1070528 RepID=A0A6C0JVY4_9ZZZZ
MIKFVLMIILLYSVNVNAEIVDSRYCGEPKRTVSGKIKRDSKIIREFKKLYPIPSELSHIEWEIDHIIPLDRGGCHNVMNLQYLPKEIKSSTNPLAKDRWERKLYPKNY